MTGMIMSLNHTSNLSGPFKYFSNFRMVCDDMLPLHARIEILMHEYNCFPDIFIRKRASELLQLPIRNGCIRPIHRSGLVGDSIAGIVGIKEN